MPLTDDPALIAAQRACCQVIECCSPSRCGPAGRCLLEGERRAQIDEAATAAIAAYLRTHLAMLKAST